jgi:glycosyltransferase involved in cell wall biosynthesis
MFPLFGSGSGTYARELAEELGKRHDIGIVVPDKREIPGVKMYPVSLPVKITFTGHPDWPNSLLYTKVSGEELSKNYLAYFRAIVEAVDDFKPDILHVHHLMLLSWIARFIKIAYKLNFIVTAHGSELPTLENDKRYPFLTAESLRKSVRIVPNSFWTKTWIQKVFGNEFNRKFRVIPGGVDILMFPEEMNTQEVNEKFQLGDRKLILFSGKLTKYKGVKYLLQAARYIDATIGIAGDGPEKKISSK